MKTWRQRRLQHAVTGCVLGGVLSIVLPGAEAAEIDSLTARPLALEDAMDAINQIFEQRIAEGVAKANARGDGLICEQDELYDELRQAVFQSLTASWGLKGYALDKQLRELLRDYSYSLALNNSIYRDLNVLEAFSLNLKELSDLVNVDGHLVGLDKLGHFFAEGWRYFELSQEEGEGLASALIWGAEQEDGKYGYATTGVYSFADLTANFNGMRFWNRVLKQEPDPIQGWFANLFSRPYVSCEVQVWESIKQRQWVRAWAYNGNFDIGDYVDGAWDEGNNCNSYKNVVIESKVEARIEEVDPGLSCPLVPPACSDAQAKYGEYARYLLHPACLVAANRERS